MGYVLTGQQNRILHDEKNARTLVKDFNVPAVQSSPIKAHPWKDSKSTLLFDYGGVKSQGRVHPGPGWLHVDL